MRNAFAKASPSSSSDREVDDSARCVSESTLLYNPGISESELEASPAALMRGYGFTKVNTLRIQSDLTVSSISANMISLNVSRTLSMYISLQVRRWRYAISNPRSKSGTKYGVPFGAARGAITTTSPVYGSRGVGIYDPRISISALSFTCT